MAAEPNNEAEIRTVITAFLDAARRKNVAQVMSFYDKELVAFDLMPPLEVGTNVYQSNWERGFADTEGPFTIEPRDLRIVADDEIAFAHALNHVTLQTKAGVDMDMWMRWTGCFRRIEGAWKIVHEQTSVPTDMETGKALFELRPVSLRIQFDTNRSS